MMNTPFHSLIDRLSEYWKIDSLSGIRCYIYKLSESNTPSLQPTPQLAPIKAQLYYWAGKILIITASAFAEDRFRGPLFISMFSFWEELLWNGGKVREPLGGRTCEAHKSRLGHDYGKYRDDSSTLRTTRNPNEWTQP